MKYDERTETVMGAFKVPLELGQKFRMICVGNSVGVHQLFRIFMQEVVDHPKRWVDEAKKKK